MKNRILSGSMFLVAAMFLGSCAKDNVEDFVTEKPQNMADYEYLNSYDVLKNYVRSDANPDFKLGLALEAGDFNSMGQYYVLAASNFNEITAGNAMKYASCVNSSGAMDFSTVVDFVNTARDAGLTIYGHTLAWHSQQQRNYLNKKIADTIIPGEPAQPAPGSENYYMHIENPTKANTWDGQLVYVLDDVLADGTYTLSFKARTEEEFELNLWQMDSGDVDVYGISPVVIAGGNNWGSYSVSFTPSNANVKYIKLIFGHLGGYLDFDDLYLRDESNNNLMPGGDFEDGTIGNWTKMYGWHSYTVSVEMEGTPGGGGGNGGYCLTMTNTAAQDNNWGAQVWYTFDKPLKNGTTYLFKAMVKATDDYNESIFLQSSADGSHQNYPGGFAISTTWEEVTLYFTPSLDDIDKFTFNFGDFVGTIYVDNVSITEVDDTDELVKNGDFEEQHIDGWRSWGGNYESLSDDGEGYSDGVADVPGYCLTMTNTAVQDNNWNAQVWYQFDTPLKNGTTYTFSAMAKATDVYNESVFLQSSTSGNQNYPGGFAIGTTWSPVSMNFTPSNDDIDKFTFNFGDFAGTIYIDDVSITELDDTVNLVKNGDFEEQHIDGWKSWSGYEKLSEEGEGYSAGGGTPDQIIEMSPEEKKAVLTIELDRWIAGMMEACQGYVTTWDVVNEAISGGGDDGEGFYVLQSAAFVSEDEAKNSFFWQDYLGSIDYVRIAVKSARTHFAENGGDPTKLKLFINDYNLESDWDDNKKLKSLIHWIGKWEEDNETVIDGIGTQMHVSCYANEATQRRKEEHVVKMLELMAATGKLVKISELDMGYVNENGEDVTTENMTEAQHKAMAEYYKFIVNKYFEIVPTAQQYGITQWCATDSPAGSGWRPNTPVGLWNKDFQRKHTYAGFADGLAGK